MTSRFEDLDVGEGGSRGDGGSRRKGRGREIRWIGCGGGIEIGKRWRWSGRVDDGEGKGWERHEESAVRRMG